MFACPFQRAREATALIKQKCLPNLLAAQAPREDSSQEPIPRAQRPGGSVVSPHSPNSQMLHGP